VIEKKEADTMLFFDLETQHSFQEVGGRHHLDKLRVSVAVTYSSVTGEYKSYTEPHVFDLIEDLFSATTVIGFNILHFDYRVLTPYTPKDLTQLKTIDMLTHIHQRLGFRVSLSSLAQATLGTDKSADGLTAVRWYREGKIDELIAYCRDDVAITRRLYDYGTHRGYVLYLDRYSGKKKQVAVNW
jgi:DEAD/DEAH box helicase domain-containing protein